MADDGSKRSERVLDQLRNHRLPTEWKKELGCVDDDSDANFVENLHTDTNVCSVSFADTTGTDLRWKAILCSNAPSYSNPPGSRPT